jgi:hypothetical protein
MAASSDSPKREGSDPALLGILALLAADRDEEDGTPTEVILEEVNLPRPDIGKVVGKSPDAVRKVIERHAAAKRKPGKAKARKGKGKA